MGNCGSEHDCPAPTIIQIKSDKTRTSLEDVLQRQDRIGARKDRTANSCTKKAKNGRISY